MTLNIVIIDKHRSQQLGHDFYQAVINQIEDMHEKERFAAALLDNSIRFQQTTDLESYLGCSLLDVTDLSRLSEEEILRMPHCPEWLCMRCPGVETFPREILCGGYLCNRWSNDTAETVTKPFYPVFLKKDEKKQRYIFVQATNEDCLFSLIADLVQDWPAFYGILYLVYTHDAELLRLFRKRMEIGYGCCNIVPLCCYLDFREAELGEHYIDLNYAEASALSALHTQFPEFIYNQVTPTVVESYARYKKEIENEDKFATYVSYRVWRLGGLTPAHLSGFRPCPESYAPFLRHWKEQGHPPCNWHGYFEEADHYCISALDTPDLTDMILAALHFTAANRTLGIEEISLQVKTNDDTELLYINLLGTFGFNPLFDPETMRHLVAPELGVTQLTMPCQTDIELTVRIFRPIDQAFEPDDAESWRRFLALVGVFVSNHVGAIADKNLIRMCYSQIQARNLSHNIGSHALVKFKNDLSLANVQLGRVIQELGTNHPDVHELKKIATTLQNLIIGQEYIAEKARYLATFALTDSTPVWHCLTTRELLNKLLYYSYVFNSLTDRDDFTVEFELQVDGKTVSPDDPEDGLYISLPEAGEFAIFNLVEGILRNSVKHEGIAASTMTLVLRLDWGGDDRINVQFYRKGSTYDTTLCEQLNGYIGESVLNRYSTQLDNRHLGIKEMYIAVEYLNGLLPGTEAYKRQLMPSFKPRLLEACPITNGDQPLTEWGYAFTLKSYKPVWIVLDDAEKDLPARGTYNYARISTWEATFIQDKGVCSAEFLAFSDAISPERIRQFLHNVPDNLLPLRRIILRTEDISAHDLYLRAWETYVRHYRKGIEVDTNRPTSYGLGKEKPDFPISYNHAWEENDRYYSEALPSKLQTTSPLYRNTSGKNLTEQEIIINKCKTLCYTTIAVYIFDERIQRLVSEQGSLQELERMLIFAPSSDAFGGQYLDKLSDVEMLEKYLEHIAHPLTRYGFQTNRENTAVIFHESMLQRLVGTEHVLEFLTRWQEKKQYSLFVTTGRGRAQFMTPDTRFVALNTLMNVVEEKSKYGLYNALMNARR